MDNDNDTDIGDRLRAAAWTPRARPDVTAIRRLAQRKVLAHRALGTAAGLVAVAGVIGALVVTADSNDDSTKVAAVDSSTTTEGTSTTEGTTTTTAELTPTTETAAPTTTDPPPTTQAPQSYDFVVDLPIDTYDEERPLVAYVRDVMLHSDPAREGGCVWATDLETGETYSISWPDGYTARFVAVDGVEQPTEIRDASETGLARTGEPVRLTSGVGGQPSKCYVGGEVLASPWEVEPLG